MALDVIKEFAISTVRLRDLDLKPGAVEDVAFLQMVRYQKDVGCCLIRSGKAQTSALNHMAKYGVLYARGRIPSGNEAGDVFVSSNAGKKSTAKIEPAKSERIAA